MNQERKSVPQPEHDRMMQSDPHYRDAFDRLLTEYLKQQTKLGRRVYIEESFP
jgi:hypothetical protein